MLMFFLAIVILAQLDLNDALIRKDITCANNGILQTVGSEDGTISQQCFCPSPYTGFYCEKKAQTCSLTECKNGGELIFSGTVKQCLCPEDYYGDDCSKSCPSGFTLLRTARGKAVGCFKYVTIATSWEAASASCVNMNSKAHLAVLENSEVEQAVSAGLKSLPTNSLSQCIGGTQFWTAAQRLTNCDCSTPFYWKPANKQMTPVSLNKWNGGEPNCATGDPCRESCAAIIRNDATTWNDLPCNWSSCYICQIDL